MTINYPPVFHTDALELPFSREGYVVLPFLQDQQLKSLRRLYEEFLGEPPTDFFSTIFLPDGPQRRRLTEELRQVIEEPLRALLPEYELCAQAFIVKRGGPHQGSLVQHQDYTFVDQSQARGVHLWCPLMDVDEHNGCLNVVAGSHELVNHISAIVNNPSPYDGVREVLEAECSTKVPMKAGSVMLFDERLMHGSEPNRSTDFRLAIGAALLPKGMKQRIYVTDPQSPIKLDVLEIEDQHAVRLVPGVRVEKPYPPGLTYLSTITYEPTRLRPADVARLKVQPPTGSARATSSDKESHTSRGGTFLTRFLRRLILRNVPWARLNR